jgi:antibiotic biosynthesis monooxygenase (ABM) superfamily enzyme
MAMSTPADLAAEVTVVTQTGVRPENTDDFDQWQRETNRIIARFPGFLKQTVLPPSPPAQDDWVILQRFVTSASAIKWLNSPERLSRLTLVEPFLTGRADVHVVRGASEAPVATPVSAIMSTRVKPGCEQAYRQWEQRVAVAQSAAKGVQGYRFEPPIAGVQDDWLAILRFDTEENLKAWLDSPVRKALVAEAEPLTQEFRLRVARTGFDQWFPIPKGGQAPPAVWKQNLIVLLLLYPVVFLFGSVVQVPLLMKAWGVPFAIALLIGNIVSVVLMNWLVPWTSNRFLWWLSPRAGGSRRVDALGAVIVGGALAVLAVVFWRLM